MRTLCLFALSVAAFLYAGTEVKAQYITPTTIPPGTHPLNAGPNGFSYLSQAGNYYFVGFNKNNTGYYDGMTVTKFSNNTTYSVTKQNNLFYGNTGIPLLYLGSNTNAVPQKPVMTFNAYLQKNGYGNLKPNGLTKYP